MDKGDFEAEHAVPRRFVDQLRAGLREMRERCVQVLDLVCDVVHSRSALRKEPADRCVLVERAQKLQPTGADADRRRLHSLLLDARALLEPSTEQPLVCIEGAVQIIDRQTDMVHRPRSLHLTIVFERLATTMRVSALALVLTMALLAGCGGSKKTAQPNGEASKPADQVFADAKSAATNANSVHVAGRAVWNATPVTLDVAAVRGKGAKGSASVNGLPFDLVQIGDTAYIKGSDAFYKHFAGPAIAQLIHGKWLKTSTTSPRFRSFAAPTSVAGIFAKFRSSHGNYVNDGKKTYQGQQVVVIRNSSDKSTLYVAATGKPYPVAIVGGKKGQSGTITFDDWNKSVSLSAPSDAIDISQFGG